MTGLGTTAAQINSSEILLCPHSGWIEHLSDLYKRKGKIKVGERIILWFWFVVESMVRLCSQES